MLTNIHLPENNALQHILVMKLTNKPIMSTISSYILYHNYALLPYTENEDMALEKTAS